MTTIKLKVVDENIEFTSTPPVYSGDVNTISTQFEFGEAWDGFAKTAVFYREIETSYMQVLQDDVCLVPHEVMKTQGRIYIGVFGVLDDKVKTSEVVYYDIGTGVMTFGKIPEPSDEIWQQILSELANIRKLAEEMAQGQEDFKNHMEEVFQDYYEELKAISANFMTVEDVDRICGGEYDPTYDDYNAEPISQEELEKILV